MGVKPIPLKKFRKFLKHIGLIKIRENDSHEIWDYPDGRLLRPVTVEKNYSEVPILHIHTNLKTLGISKSEFANIIKTL